MSRLPLTLAVLLVGAAAPANAHPHVFTEAGYELIFDEAGHLASFRTTWIYDELFSLLIIEDGGYDTDGDGAISGLELNGIIDFDSQRPLIG